jgi:hypothetical protein
VERERIHGGAGAVGAGCGLLSGSSHMNGDRLVCPSDHSVFDGRRPTGRWLATALIIDGEKKTG